jgi:hypothetical protein
MENVERLDSICNNGRNNIVLETPCARATFCLINPYLEIGDEACQKLCSRINCTQSSCPSIYEYPSSHIVFDHVRFIFKNKDSEFDFRKFILPDYVCYDEKLCRDFLPHTVRLNDSTCCHFHKLGLRFKGSLYGYLLGIENIFRKCLVVSNETHYCNYSMMYQCENSTKCISKHRLVDGIRDCPFDDDEAFNGSCSLKDFHYRVECSVGLGKKCFSPLVIEDFKEDCQNGKDEFSKETEFSEYHIYFQNICDNITHLSAVLIHEQNETDETECQHWPCNNTYTRCDGFWSCKDGADEISCPSSTFPELEHSCVFPNDTLKISWLPIARAHDGIIDCLGASDERHHC